VERSAVVFFASRRRHTRSTRDWSSDVCSSDLRMYDLAVKAIDALSVSRENPEPMPVLKAIAQVVNDDQVKAQVERDRLAAILEKIGRASCRDRVSTSVVEEGL